MRKILFAGFAALTLVVGTVATMAPAHAYTFSGYQQEQQSSGGVQGGEG